MFWGHLIFKTNKKLTLKPFQSNGQVIYTTYLFTSISSLLNYLLIYLFICSCWACILSLHKLNVFIWDWTPLYCFPFEVLKFIANSVCLSHSLFTHMLRWTIFITHHLYLLVLLDHLRLGKHKCLAPFYKGFTIYLPFPFIWGTLKE